MAIDSRRWFYNELSGLAAEKLLIEKGEPGSFLIRQSHNSPGNFTLSVRRKDSFAHIRIQNTGDFLSFFGGDKFATLAELVNYYREHPDQLKEKNGTIIELRYPLIVDNYISENARWFHGRQTANEAQNLLLQKGRNGSFLVRESIRQPGSYVLSVVSGRNTVSHILVNRLPNSKFDLGDGQEFSTLGQLIEHYSDFPIMVKDGDLICLKQPFNVTRLNVSCLDQRITQLEKESIRGKRVTGFWEEFEELHDEPTASNSVLQKRSEGSRPCNAAKNRYKNILPFDATRVILRDGDPSIPGSDYINANYISNPPFLREGLLNPLEEEDKEGSNQLTSLSDKGREETKPDAGGASSGEKSGDSASKPINRRSRIFFSSRPQYIATQGVLPGTVVDMWRMIWQERASIIVMLTKENERGRNKCEKYWPTELEGPLILAVPQGILKITAVSERNLTSRIIREMRVSLHRRKEVVKNEGTGALEEQEKGIEEEDDSFTVYLLQFLAWPDQGTPSEPSEFLDLLFNISSFQESMETTGPMIVHCSSGIGRTGTLIVVDMLLGCIYEGGLHTDIDIARTVQAVREQRSGMVQTEAQYRFIYKAVQEFVSSLLLRVKERNALKPFGIDYTNLKQTPKSDGCLCCTGIASLPNASSLSSSLPNSSRSFWSNSNRSSNCRPKPTPPPLPPLNSPGDVAQSNMAPSSTTSRRWYKLSSASR